MFIVLELTPNINTEFEWCRPTSGKLESNYATAVESIYLNQYVLTSDPENRVTCLSAVGLGWGVPWALLGFSSTVRLVSIHRAAPEESCRA